MSKQWHWHDGFVNAVSAALGGTHLSSEGYKPKAFMAANPDNGQHVNNFLWAYNIVKPTLEWKIMQHE
jgi:hypothetical protein